MIDPESFGAGLYAGFLVGSLFVAIIAVHYLINDRKERDAWYEKKMREAGRAC